MVSFKKFDNGFRGIRGVVVVQSCSVRTAGSKMRLSWH